MDPVGLAALFDVVAEEQDELAADELRAHSTIMPGVHDGIANALRSIRDKLLSL